MMKAGGGTDFEYTSSDVGIVYHPDYLEVVSNANDRDVWVNAGGIHAVVLF